MKNNYTKEILVTIAFLLMAAFSAKAQSKADKDRIEALKIAFITEELSLSSKEAETFWPIYNQYKTDREALRNKERTQFYDKLKVLDQLSDAEAKRVLEQHLKIEKEEEELDEAYYQNLAKITSPKKVLKLIKAEDDFRRQMIRQYHEKMRKKNGGRMP